MLLRRQLITIMTGLWNLVQAIPLKQETCTTEEIPEKLAVTVDLSRLVILGTELHFAIAGSGDVRQVVDFLMENFWPDCPLTEMTGMDIDAEISPWFEEFIRSAIGGGLSLIVRDEDNLIVGVVISQLHRKQPAEDFRSFTSSADPETRPMWTKMCRLVEDLNETIHFDQDPVLSMELVAVRRDYRNRGIAVQMVAKTLQIARATGSHLVKTESMGRYLAEGLIHRLGFAVAKQINYNNYYQNGERPFRTASIDNNAWLLVRHV